MQVGESLISDSCSQANYCFFRQQLSTLTCISTQEEETRIQESPLSAECLTHTDALCMACFSSGFVNL